MDHPEHKAAWGNRPPEIFTAKVTEFHRLVAGLEDLLREHDSLTTGAAPARNAKKPN